MAGAAHGKGTRGMIGYVTVGADDVARAKRFYPAFLPVLGYGLEEGPEGPSYVLPERRRRVGGPPDFYVKPPFDGGPASAGNGAMVAFRARSQREVRELHAAALAAGGAGQGAAGVPRRLWGAVLRGLPSGPAGQ